MITEPEGSQYQWTERNFYVDSGCPEGMCWSVREMCSYGYELERFIPHLQAMAEGLEQARYSEYHQAPGSGLLDDDNYGPFIIGLRPMTPDDKTEAMAAAERRASDERALLRDLAAKYPDVTDTICETRPGGSP